MNLERKNHPVIFIQHDGTNQKAFLPCSEDWELLDSLPVMETDAVVSKTANDAFYQSSLDDLLNTHKISELWVTGCATDFCVEATIQSALHKDYHIVVVSNGHTTADRPHLRADRVIAHYNWVWANMTPTSGSISVKPYPLKEAIRSF